MILFIRWTSIAALKLLPFVFLYILCISTAFSLSNIQNTNNMSDRSQSVSLCLAVPDVFFGQKQVSHIIRQEPENQPWSGGEVEDEGKNIKSFNINAGKNKLRPSGKGICIFDYSSSSSSSCSIQRNSTIFNSQDQQQQQHLENHRCLIR